MKNFAPIWRGSIEKGEILMDIKENVRYHGYLHTLRGEIELVVRKWRKRRTNPQNKYYWGVVIPLLCEYTGYSDEEIHEALKWKFLRKKEQEILPTVRSTADLSTTEFMNYVDRIVQWSAEELKVIIPEVKKIEINE